MSEVTIIGVDLAKQVFQVHGARADGSVAFRKKLSRAQFMPFLAKHPQCTIAMEACATAHGWGREIGQLGHEVKLIPPQYVKAYVKRQKNDKADAEAITEAASRPTMRFVEVKTVEQQSRAMLFRSRKMFIGQRTQSINALRGHLAEYGVIGPKSKAGLKKLIAALDAENNGLPNLVCGTARMYLEHIDTLSTKISDLTKQLESVSKSSGTVRRLKTMPGVGLQTALAIEAFAPDMSCFKRGRDFAAWLGLVPLQRSTGGKDRLGKISKMGQKDIRSLLITGAMSVITAATRFGVRKGSWLAKMLDRKPKMLVAITLANRMARAIWAMLTKQENYRNPEAMA
ncbi:IS110 family transposase [Ruegeria atlantica]|uniref:IS110 family transposase n=1 Tax=Ruegeria atlantica TaxID=81569 RepID=UPI001479FF84